MRRRTLLRMIAALPGAAMLAPQAVKVVPAVSTAVTRLAPGWYTMGSGPILLVNNTVRIAKYPVGR